MAKFGAIKLMQTLFRVMGFFNVQLNLMALMKTLELIHSMLIALVYQNNLKHLKGIDSWLLSLRDRHGDFFQRVFLNIWERRILIPLGNNSQRYTMQLG